MVYNMPIEDAPENCRSYTVDQTKNIGPAPRSGSEPAAISQNAPAGKLPQMSDVHVTVTVTKCGKAATTMLCPIGKVYNVTVACQGVVAGAIVLPEASA